MVRLMRLEYLQLIDIANKDYESIEVYHYIIDNYFKNKGLVNIRNIILCNYLYL